VNRNIIFILVGLLLIVSACTSNSVSNDSSNNTNSNGIVSINITNNSGQIQQGNESKFAVTINGANIEPATINVKKNQKVTLSIVNDGSDFVFTIPGVGVDEITEGAASVDYTFTPNETGIYNLVCVSGCPEGVTEYDGLIVVS